MKPDKPTLRPAPTAGETFKELTELAIPLVLVQASTHFAGFIDTVLIGRVGEVELGATGLGASVFLFTTIAAMGICMGIDPIASQAFGAGKSERARTALWQGLYQALALALPFTLLYWGVGLSMELFGVVPEVAAGSLDYVLGRIPAVLPFLLMTVLRGYLQAARLTRAIVVSSIAANVFNFVADWILIYGDEGLRQLGLPELGVEPMGVFGVGMASSMAAYLQLGIMSLGLRSAPEPAGVSRSISWPLQGEMFRLGLPVGLQFLAEVGVFSAVQVIMGGLGTQAVAAHQVAIMLASLTFSVCVGVGAATSVQVGRAVGACDRARVRAAGLAGLVLGVGFMACTAVAMWLIPTQLARLMTTETRVIELAAVLLVIAGFFQIVDGIQAVGAGILRGAGRTREAFIANFVGHWFIGMPIALFLCFGVDMGPAGLWWGLTSGLAVVAVALSWEFYRMVRSETSWLEVSGS